MLAVASGVWTQPGQASTSREDHLRAEIAHLLNGERDGRGLGQLPVDARLAEQAQAAAERLRATACTPSPECHSPDAEAEILAWGGPESSSGAIVEAWMRSAQHRDILLHGTARSMGVGFACAERGSVYAAVHFGGVRKPVPATPEEPVASRIDEGSSCAGAAMALSQTTTTSSTTSTTSTTSPPPRPSGSASPAPSPTSQPRPAATVAPTPPSPATAASAPLLAPETTMPPTTTSTTGVSFGAPGSARVGLQAVPAGGEIGVVYAADQRSGTRSEPAFVVMVMVVVFLSVLRIGSQLRAAASSEHGVRRAGL